MTESKRKYIERSLRRSMESVDKNDLKDALKNLIVACGYQLDETERLKEQLRIDGELFIGDDGELIDLHDVTHLKGCKPITFDVHFIDNSVCDLLNGTNASNPIDNA